MRGYRIELGEIETVLDHHPAITKSVVITREDTPGSVRLVAYLVGPSGPDALPKGVELKDYLKKKLPEYMVPAIYVPLAEMPLTPNGKVNRRALPKPDPSLLRTKEFVPPRDDKEKQLAAVWQKILDIKEVGAEDDFFDLGGDSLLVIRMITAAKKEGLLFTTKQVFQHKILGDLAKVEGSSKILAEQGDIVGEVPLSPAMEHFLDLGHPNPDWHTLGAFISAKQGSFDLDALKAAFRKVLEHHDTLRMYLSEKDGKRIMICEAPWEELPFEEVDFTHLSEEQQQASVQDHWRGVIKSLDIHKPPLIRGVYYVTDKPFFFLFGHFLIADIGSWTTLLDDLDTAYRNISRGEKLELQPKTTAFRDWVDRLITRANGPEIEPEKGYWMDERIKDTAIIPIDFPDGVNLMRSSQSVYLDLDADFSETLLKKIPRTTGAQIDAIILTAVLYGIEELTGNRSLRINLLGHGREPLYDDIDLTRTIGWLNTIFPSYLTLGDAPHPAAALKQVNKQLRALPSAGLGYGLLRYLNQDKKNVADNLASLPPAQIFFNYFGSDHRSELTVISKDEHFGGYGYDLETHRLCPLAVAGHVLEDKFLRIRFEFSKNLHKPETIEKLAATALATLEKLRVNH